MIAAKVVFISWHISSYFESDLFRFPVQQLKKAVVNLQRMFVMSYKHAGRKYSFIYAELELGRVAIVSPEGLQSPVTCTNYALPLAP